ARDEDIGVAVVIEVGDSDPGGIAFTREARLSRDIRKCHVAVVAKEAVIKFGAGFLQARNGRAIGKEDVLAAIIVVIEHADAPARKLDLMKLAGCAVVGFKAQPGLRGDFGEADGPGRYRENSNAAQEPDSDRTKQQLPA